MIQGAGIRMLPGSGTIVIGTPDSGDEGEYQCFADNAHGTAVSLRAMLKRAGRSMCPLLYAVLGESRLV